MDSRAFAPRAGIAQGEVPDSCAARMLDHSSRATASVPPEYLLDVSAGDGRRLYFGVVHGSDPADPQFAAIRKRGSPRELAEPLLERVPLASRSGTTAEIFWESRAIVSYCVTRLL